jgi:SAM-dependent methyltransferase/uncharacterized iron-regulated protein
VCKQENPCLRPTNMTGRTMMQNVWHRFVGVRGAANLFSDPSVNRSSNFCQVYSNPSEEIAKHRLVFLGEIHSVPPIISFQREVLAEMSERANQLHVVLEHFSFDMQDLLDQYSEGSIDFEELVQKYHEMGEEGHRLEVYRELLEDAKRQGVRLHAGFLPRKYARMLMKQGPEETLQAASQYLPPVVDLEGSEFHYNVFESLISGRSIYGGQSPTDQFRRIFQAQILKDEAMASKLHELMEINKDTDDKFLVIAGNGHLLHYCGVPERVLAKQPELAPETCLVISESTIESFGEETNVAETLKARFGEEGSNPADYIYYYRIPEEEFIKEETRKAYDKVGESAALPGNMSKAAWIMHHLGYSEEQFQTAGTDAYNFQGVGNPHIHANIQPGERVLDVGSGLGIDSFLACHATGPLGQVIGIDISAKEVQHAQARAKDRGFDAEFLVADMESIPLADNSIDVVISNGAFCLAPNKEKAFRELFRVLKPGGRISICTTTTQVENLEPGVSWPLCMKMFISKNEIEPLCEEIGYIDVVVDDSDSLMSMEMPEDILKESNPDRNRVHVGGEDFKHLEDYDMDKICARVCVVARKPKE